MTAALLGFGMAPDLPGHGAYLPGGGPWEPASLLPTSAFADSHEKSGSRGVEAGVPEKFDGGFYQKVQALAASQQTRSGTPYYHVVIVVATHDGSGNDVSSKNKAAVAAVLKGVGGRGIFVAESLPFLTASVPVSEINGLSRHGQVYRLGDGQVRVSYSIDTARATVNATAPSLGGANGSGVAVAVIDTGINHPLLNSRTTNVVCQTTGCSQTEDIAGLVHPSNPAWSTHGSRVGMVMAAAGLTGLNGLSPGVELVSLYPPTPRLGGTDIVFMYHAMDWAVTNGAKVANISFGAPAACGTFRGWTGVTIANDAANKGLFVAMSAGNNGLVNGTIRYSSMDYPACGQNVVAVGGMDDRADPDKMYLYSARGPVYHGADNSKPVLKPEMVAPAHGVVLPGYYVANNTAGAFSGTSYSTPMVSAAAAILSGEDKGLDPLGLKAALLLGADWKGPIPCTSVQYEQNDTSDDCSYARQPQDNSTANGPASLGILNNVGFGILDVGQSLHYVRQGDGAHVTSGSVAAGSSRFYSIEVAGAGDTVKVILAWNHPTRITSVQNVTVHATAPDLPDLGFTVACAGMETVTADSSYQNNEFAVFEAAQAGPCTVTVSADAGADYALASTARLDRPFVTTWRTTSANETISLPVRGSNMAIDWGDGHSSRVPLRASGTENHSYENAGDHTVSVHGGLQSVDHFTHLSSNHKLLSIDQWGDAPWTTMKGTFFGTVDMTYKATDIPDLSRVTDMSHMFKLADVFNGNLSSWDVSNVRDMSWMFSETTQFNQDLDMWDVSQVTNMGGMFDGATSFNGDIPGWDVSNVRNMSRMFDGATVFNQPIGSWNVSNVRDMSGMFSSANTFNGDISSWDVSNVRNMNRMFDDATSFRQNLGEWYIVPDGRAISDDDDAIRFSAQNSYLDRQSPVYRLNETAENGGKFVMAGSRLKVALGQTVAAGNYTVTLQATGTPFGTANSRNVTVTLDRDVTGTGFRPFVTTWRTDAPGQNVTIPVGGSTATYDIDWGDGTSNTGVSGNQTHVYQSAGNYTVSISAGLERIYLEGGTDANAARLASIDSWGDASWDTMEGAFEDAVNMAYNATDAPDLRRVADMSSMFAYTDLFDGNVSSWDVSGVTDMSYMFDHADSFNQDLDGWDVSSVTDMDSMFWYASAFDGNVSSWNVSQVTDMSYMFGASDFNGDLSSWNVSQVRDMNQMLAYSDFNGDISGWDVSGVTNMFGMFITSDSFNQDLDGWDVSQVTNMAEMFWYASAFDGNVSSWNVSKVTTMQTMFSNANSFNGDISGWNVSQVTSMHGMFEDANSFDGDISGWDVSQVTYMSDMFRNATSFNQPIGSWNVSSAQYMYDMFEHATSFSQNLGGWYVSPAGASIQGRDVPGAVGRISAQNGFLDRQNATYQLGTGGDSGRFVISENDVLEMLTTESDRTSYAINVTVSGDSLFGGGSHQHTVSVNVDDIVRPFVTTWRTTGANETISFPVRGSNMAIDWGDGHVSRVPSRTGGTEGHSYENAGDHIVSVHGGLQSVDHSTHLSNNHKLLSIDQWGDAPWTTMKGAFYGAFDMTYKATDIPDLSRVTDTSSMFRFAYAFNGNLSSWDVSNVRDMSNMLADASRFNGDISFWDVSQVTDMDSMFAGADSFDADISSWDVSNVRDMSNMFLQAEKFNQDISGWDVSNVRDMNGMFKSANSFEQNLGEWYIVPDGLSIPSAGDYVRVWAQNRYLDRQGPVYSVNDTRFAFDGRTLEPNPANPPVTGSYALRISAGGGVFGAGNSLDVVIDFAGSQFVTTWQTTAPNQVITIPVGGSTATYSVNWGDGTLEEGVTGDRTHAYPSAGNYTVAISGNFEKIRLEGGTDANAARLASIDQWGDASWTTMEGAFAGAASMAYKAADAPDLSRVADMSSMFANASAFNGDISGWDVSRVTDMESMFANASAFNGDISGWDVSRVTDMSSMFAGASSFRQNLGEWYIVPDRLKHLGAVRPIVVSAQNAFLDGQDPVYAVNDTRFAFDGRTLKPNPDDDPASGSYALRISAGGDVFGAGNSLDVVIDLADRPFVTTWRTTNPGETVSLPVRGSDMIIHWGDGHSSRVPSRTGGTENHSYENAGDHAVSVYGDLQSVRMNAGAYAAQKLRSIDQWGDAPWTTMKRAFDSMSFMVNRATDAPDLSRVTDMSGMFAFAYHFNADLSSWDVSNVRDMESMFHGAVLFNGNVSTWDVSGVTDMRDMFNEDDSFNGDISGWDVSSVTDMAGMFDGANSFRQNLGEWYIVPDDLTVYSASDAVRISAQNSYLDGQRPAYRLDGTAGDGGKFRMAGNSMVLAPDQNLAAGDYSVTIHATGSLFGTANSRNMTVTLDQAVNTTGTGTGASRPFVTTWQTTAANQAITIPVGRSAAAYDIDWGDGTARETVSGDSTHTYSTAGTYTVSIYGGFERIHLAGGTDANAARLASIDSWGDISWDTMEGAFEDAVNMAYNATDAPDLSRVTDMSDMFNDADAFNSDISSWNVSNVRDMHRMFSNANIFNGDISGWDVSSVTNMERMFDDAFHFNQDLDRWDVSQVTNMDAMFSLAFHFNGSISTWDVSNVRDMSDMFNAADAFNQDISGWNVSSVTNMYDMFLSALAFNQDISGWNVSSVTNMRGMFWDARSFNQPIGSWDVSGVTDMNRMFDNARSFRQNLGGWYIVSDGRAISDADDAIRFSAQNSYLDRHIPVYRLNGTAEDGDKFVMSGSVLNVAPGQTVTAGDYAITVQATGTKFGTANSRNVTVTLDRDVSGTGFRPFVTTWETDAAGQNVTIPVGGSTATYSIDWGDGTPRETVLGDSIHTYSAAGNHTVSIYGSFERIVVSDLGSNSDKLRSIDSWGDISWTTMNQAFAGADNLVYKATDAPDLSGVTDMSWMFGYSDSFDGNIEYWDVSSVTNMYAMFAGAESFNQPLNYWDVSGVTNMGSMFAETDSFNQDLDRWDVSSVNSMLAMFGDAKAFNGNVEYWDVSGVTDMGYMFDGAESFNRDLDRWDVSRVTNMIYMFQSAAAFDADVSSWDVSGVTAMNGMFVNAGSFNGDVSSWDVSGVIIMYGMFASADSFSGDISSWDVSNVTNMESLFWSATSFNGDVSAWDVSGVTDMRYMFGNTYFNGDISSWDVSGVTNMELMFENATSFNQDISSWDVSSATNMEKMFNGATSFRQNLGEWYVVPHYRDVSDITDTIRVSAQNAFLDGQDPIYRIDAAAGDGGKFVLVGNALAVAPHQNVTAGDYTITVQAAGSVFGTANSRNVTVTLDSDVVWLRPFVTTWQTDASNQNVTIPVGGSTAAYYVDWGDGTTYRSASGDSTHAYSAAGNHTVSVYGGFERIRLGDDNGLGAVFENAERLRSIDQWGDISWTSMGNAFFNAANMTYKATDAPDLRRVADMSSMFNSAAKFNGDISDWDVSGVTDMFAMFHFAVSFNQDLNDWDVSGVANMGTMFAITDSFNGNVSSWNVSQVTDMDYMFWAATAFNQDISGWNVSSVTYMKNMFHGATAFNQPIGSWNVSQVTGMDEMFANANSFRQNLGKWYIVPDGMAISDADGAIPISAQNAYLDRHDPTYLIDMAAGDGSKFRLTDDGLAVAAKNLKAGNYTVTIRAISTGFGTANMKTVNVTLTADVTTLGFSPFVTTWLTDFPGQTVTIPVRGSAAPYDVDWGDNTVEKGVSGTQTHRYSDAGNHTVAVSVGFERIYMKGNFGAAAGANADRLVSIDQWGDVSWTDMDGAFWGAKNMVLRATDSPDLSGVTDMSYMFANAHSFDGDISGWDVSGVTEMDYTFSAARSFNSDLNGWDVSKVTGMDYMFWSAAAFNGDISGWHVSGVAGMDSMFSGATAFNGNVSSWDVSGVADMKRMFSGAASFNGNVSSWDVSGVPDMKSMFAGATSFNQPIGSWDVSGVADMSSMFLEAESFNSDLDGWDVSGVTDMSSMFEAAIFFNRPISSWNVSGVTDMSSMFQEVRYNQDIGSWNVSGVTGMSSMFEAAIFFNQDISSWDVSKVADMSSMFQEAVSFNQDISSWDVSKVTDMNQMFAGASSFRQNLGEWYVVPDGRAISDAGDTIPISAQNPFLDGQGPTYRLDRSSAPGSHFRLTGDDGLAVAAKGLKAGNYTVTVHAAGQLFGTANSRNVTVTLSGDIAEDRFRPFITIWRTDAAGQTVTIPVGGATGNYTVDWGDGTSSVNVTGDQTHAYAAPGDHTVSISGDFERIYLPDAANAARLASIDSWGDVSWTTMHAAFWEAKNMAYNAVDLPDLSGVTDMQYAFWRASSFNGDLSAWDVSEVTDMGAMFFEARSFNGDLSGWSVSKVTKMSSMFGGAWRFNGDISSWDVSQVTTMAAMFSGARAFNQDISSWDVSGVADMAAMFSGARAFSQDISSWDVSSATNMELMFENATSFNQPIGSWDVSQAASMNLMFDGASSFHQNLGGWYVTPKSIPVPHRDIPGEVGRISSQNAFLDRHVPVYGTGTGGDSGLFAVTDGVLYMNSKVPGRTSYSVNVTASRGSVFEDGNNWQAVRVTLVDVTGPTPALSTDSPPTTSAASAAVKVDFGEPVDPATFTISDVSVTGGNATHLAHVSGNQTFTFTITPDSDGTTVHASIPAGRVTDVAGNDNAASGSLGIKFDKDSLSTTLSTGSPVTNADSAGITVEFARPVNATTFTISDVSVNGGSATGLAPSPDNQTFTFTITPDSDGTVSVIISADSVADMSGNNNTASNELQVTFDRTALGVILSTGAASPTGAGSVAVTVEFSKPVNATTFTLPDVSVDGGSATGLEPSPGNRIFTFTLAPDSDGMVNATIPAGRVADAAGNGNAASNVLQVTFDRTPPVPELSTDTASPTNAGSVTVTVDFGEPVDPATFTLPDVSVDGGSATGLEPSQDNRTFTFTLAPDSDGTVNATIPAGSLADAAGNGNIASNVLQVTFDRTAPVPELSTGQSTTDAASVTVTVKFGEPIDPATFTLPDVSVDGGSATDLLHSSGNRTFTFTLAPDSDGTVNATIPAGRLADAAGNDNAASNVLQVTFDRMGFDATLSTDLSTTNADSVTVTVEFGEPVDPATFTISDVTVDGGSATGPAHSPDNRTFTFTLVPDSDGTVDAAIPAGSVTNTSGDGNAASNVLQVTFDRIAPVPELSTDTASPTNADSILVTVDFGEPVDVTTFTLPDVSVDGGTPSDLARSPGDQTFTFTLTPDSDGTVDAAIPAGRVTDVAGNANAASNTLQMTFNSTDPVVVVSDDMTAPVIIITGDASVSIVAGSQYGDLGATCDDRTDGDLTSSISTDSTVDASTAGTYQVTYTCTDSAGNSAQKSRTVTVEARPVKTGSDGKTWTVDDMVGTMGGKGQHDLELISRCDEGTDPTGASTELHLLGLLGQASYGTSNVDMETTWVDIIEAYRLASHSLDTGKDAISEDAYEDGITLDQYIDAAPGDVFEYPDGNYTKAQLGGMTAWSASIDWTGDGSCSLDFRQETWVP